MIRNTLERIKANRKGTLFLTTALLVAAAGAANLPSFAVRALSKFGVSSAPAAKPASEPQQQSRKPDLLVVYATTSGFEPRELTTRPGKNNLLILNRSGADALEYSVVLKPGNSPDFKARARLDSNVLTQLPFGAGEALLTEASNPNWVCKIKVVP